MSSVLGCPPSSPGAESSPMTLSHLRVCLTLAALGLWGRPQTDDNSAGPVADVWTPDRRSWLVSLSWPLLKISMSQTFSLDSCPECMPTPSPHTHPGPRPLR